MKNIYIKNFFWFVAFISFNSQFAFAAELKKLDELTSLQGRWKVTEVHINTSSPSTPTYDFNDQRLVGRIFNFGKKNITSNTPEGFTCTEASATVISHKLSYLISQSLAAYGDPPNQPSPSDYMIAMQVDRPLDVILATCSGHIWNDGLGADGPIRGSWIVSVNHNQLLIRWYGETILVLKKVQDNAKPSPSYTCTGSMSDAESTICASFELSEFDRSIQTEYGKLIRQAQLAGSRAKTLVLSQRDWLRKRDSCHKDDKCIQTYMENRLEQLTTESSHQ